jgi:hypothetical protein
MQLTPFPHPVPILDRTFSPRVAANILSSSSENERSGGDRSKQISKPKVTLLLTIILLNTNVVLFAQSPIEPVGPRPLKSIYTTLAGDATIISINYDKIFPISQILRISGKIGSGYNEEFRLCIWGGCNSPQSKYLTIPHHITGNIGKGRHLFEFGLGGTVIIGSTTQPYFIYPIVGYRILPLRSNKITFRIFGQLPFPRTDGIFLADDIIFMPVGLSLGVSFSNRRTIEKIL